MSKFLIIFLLSVWIVIIAIVAAQNGTPVSLQFLTFQIVPLPFGIMLAFCAVIGMLGTAIALSLWQLGRR